MVGTLYFFLRVYLISMFLYSPHLLSQYNSMMCVLSSMIRNVSRTFNSLPVVGSTILPFIFVVLVDGSYVPSMSITPVPILSIQVEMYVFLWLSYAVVL